MRRLFLLTLAALAVRTPVALAQARPTTWTVSYHGKGKSDYHLFGHYASKEAADRIVKWLREHGNFETKVTPGTTPIPKPPALKPTALLPAGETVSLAKAREVFRKMAQQKDIAFRYPIDGCYARAELMIERMRQEKLRPHRVWSVANGEPLHATTKNVKAGFVEWGYHVAPLLRVRSDAKTQRWYVIDPSLFTQPASIEQWQAAQMKAKTSHKPYITLTKVGEAPVWIDHKRKNGTGYWPASDPREGLHGHAVLTMRRYKALEGRVDAGDAPVRWYAFLEARHPFDLFDDRRPGI